MILIIQDFIGIQRLIHSVWFSINTLIKILAFIGVTIAVYSLFACSLFGKITKGEFFSDISNYADFFKAFLMLVKVSTRNNWRFIYAESFDHNEFCKEDAD